MSASRAKPPILFPETDPEEAIPDRAPTTRGISLLARAARPAAYVASALVGAILVLVVSGMVRGRFPSLGGSSANASPASAATASATTAVTLDGQADTLALAIAAFSMRARMYDSHRMGCSGLSRGLQQVENGWLAYNIARKETLAAFDSVRDNRDRSLYADVRAVELRFERSSCTRP